MSDQQFDFTESGKAALGELIKMTFELGTKRIDMTLENVTINNHDAGKVRIVIEREK